MGTTFRYKCSNCSYESFNSEKEDKGRLVLKKPMICNVCDEIVDVIIDIHSANSEQYDRLKSFLYKCPECEANSLREWVDRICPKCESKMIRNEIVEYWD